MSFLVIYVLIINLTSGAMMVLDKRYAINKAWRIPESNLLFLCAVGGFIGTYCAMKFARHKTQQGQFHVAVILSGILWLIILPLFWFLMASNVISTECGDYFVQRGK